MILSKSESAKEFATKMKALARHTHDGHEWDSGRCNFHQLQVCSCDECKDGEDLKCEGTDYLGNRDSCDTSYVLTCPFHSLAYEIDVMREQEYLNS